MLQLDKTGSQMMCMIRGRGCVTLAIILTVTMVINMILLSVVINTEMTSNRRSYHGNHMIGDHSDTIDSPEYDGMVKNMHKLHEKHHKNKENSVIHSNPTGNVNLKGFDVALGRSKFIPSSPLPRPSDVQVAVITSVVPPKSEKPKSGKDIVHGVPPLILAQAHKVLNIVNRQEATGQNNNEGKHHVAQDTYNSKSNSAVRDPGYRLTQSEASAVVKSRAGRQTRQIQSMEHQLQPHTDTPSGLTATVKHSGHDSQQDSVIRQKLLRTKEKLDQRKPDVQSRAGYTLHSLAIEPVAQAVKPSSARRQARLTRKQRLERKQKRLETKSIKQERSSKRKKQQEEGETFSTRDMKTFQKHLRRKERRQQRLNSYDQLKSNEKKEGNKKNSDKNRNLNNNKEKKRKDKAQFKNKEKKDRKSETQGQSKSERDNDKKQIHEYNVEHKTDEEWEPHEDMSSDQLLLASQRPINK